jgi:hypothetical protein
MHTRSRITLAKNPRIALAVAGTTGNNEIISGFSDDELFRRLLQQGREEDVFLCSPRRHGLSFIFQGENVSDDDEALGGKGSSALST